MSGTQFKEIEHKFVVGSDFDLEAMRRTLDSLGPSRHECLRVRDRYFVTEAGRQRGYILRHRYDRERHELTIKSIGEDSEVRDEINLALSSLDQDAHVDAFAAAQGPVWQGTVWKDLEVWYFSDCEIVYYVASADAGPDLRQAQVTPSVPRGEGPGLQAVRSVACVEFEAIGQPTLTEAVAILERYERLTGFSGRQRTRESLMQLMWPGVWA